MDEICSIPYPTGSKGSVIDAKTEINSLVDIKGIKE